MQLSRKSLFSLTSGLLMLGSASLLGCGGFGSTARSFFSGS